MAKPLYRRALLLFVGMAAAVPARALDGVWHSTKVHPSQLAGFSPATITPDGTPFVLYSQGVAGGFLAHWDGAGWISEPVTSNYTAGAASGIKADSQGAVHMVFNSFGGPLRYARRDGSGITHESVPGATNPGSVRLLVDPTDRPGILHRSSTGSTVYRTRISSGVWSQTTISTSTSLQCEAAMAPNQDVFVGCNDGSLTVTPVVVYRISGTSVTVAGTMPQSRFFRPGLAVDGAGTLFQAMVYDSGPNYVLGLASLAPPAVYAGQIFVNAISLDAIAVGPDHVLALGKYNSASGGELLEKNGPVITTETLTFPYTGADVFSPALSPGGKLYISAGSGFHAKLSTTSTLLLATRSASGLGWSLTHPAASDATGFRLRRAGDGADLSGLLAAGTGAFAQTGLTPNAPHQVALDNVFRGFIVRSSTQTVYTLAAAPRALSLTRTAGGGLSALWSANGNPGGTEYRLHFRSAAGFTLDQTLTNTSLFLPSVLPAPTALTLEAVAGDGTVSPFAVLSTFTQTGQSWRAAFDFLDGQRADVVITGPADGQSLVLAAGPVDVFPAATAPIVDLTGTGVGLQVVTGQALPANVGARVTLHYAPGAVSGPSDSLILARFDSGHGAWVPLPTAHDPLARTFTSPLDAFGVLQVMSRAGAVQGLGNAAVYPNPFRPRAGVLTLREIPAGARIKIMTAGGRVVRELSGTEQPAIQWDGRDARGDPVKSGVYTLRIESNGEDRRFKVLVEN